MFLLNFFIIAILFTKYHCHDLCEPSSKWMRESSLEKDGKMVMKWNFTDNDITVMMIAQTSGWVAVGFGPVRKKFIDFAVGWISNNKTFLEDRSMNNSIDEPTVDKKRSIDLIAGNEVKNLTYLCFRRKLLACDDEDFTLLDGTIKVSWSFGDTDPSDGKLQYQKSKKGEKLLKVLSVVYPKPSSETYSIQSPNTTISSKMGSTVYWCSYHRIAPMTDQHYMLGFDVIVANQSKGIVHHMGLYVCNSEEMAKIFDTIDPQGYDLDDKRNTPLLKYCRTIIAVWAQGGEDQYFPPSTGTPFGSPNSTTYYRLEPHFNIAPEQKEITDNSFMRIYITKEKPKNNLAILFTGFQIAPLLVIPPEQKNFSVIAGCQSKCLQQNIPKDGITVIGARFHGHLKAIKFKLHIFREGQEIKPIAENDFHFEFQSFRFFKDELKLKPNDKLAIECIYDTTGANRTIVGEEATENEMCIIFLMYYPRMDNLDMCMSFVRPENITNLTEIQEIGLPKGVQKCEGSDCQAPFALSIFTPPVPIIKPSQYANETLDKYLMNYTNWTPTKVQKLQELYYGEQNSVCSGNGKVYYSTVNDSVQYPNDIVPYDDPNSCKK